MRRALSATAVTSKESIPLVRHSLHLVKFVSQPAVEDMAHKAVRMEVAEFRDTFFPLPEGIMASKHPQWPADIFDGLAAGDKLTEQEIQACFVCFSRPTGRLDAPLIDMCR